MDEKKLSEEVKQPSEERDVIQDRFQKDFEAIRSWVDKDVMNLEKKYQDFVTHISHGHQLKEIFSASEVLLKRVILSQEQLRYFTHLLALSAWFFHLSVCASQAEKVAKNCAHAKIFTEISNHLFLNFILLRDNLSILLKVNFNSFNEKYANLLVYAIVKNFLCFYKTYCSWFRDQIPPINKESDIPKNGWEKVGYFIKRLRNKSEHEYYEYSSSNIDLKDFDSSLEIDFRDPEYNPKLGNTIHKYPLAILVFIRFVLKDQDSGFDEINRDWFSCDQKVLDQFGNVKCLNPSSDLEKKFN